MIPSPRYQRAFTLIELLVSVALFAVVVTITMTAYLRLISIDRRSRATNDVVTNLSFVIDSMARSIRTGTAYRCNGGYNCPGGDTKFSFKDENGKDVTYLLVSTPSGNYIGECQAGYVSCNANSTPLPTPVTDPRINILNLTFYVKGAPAGVSGPDGTQPQVVFTLQGSLNVDSQSAPTIFTVESGATQRYLDL